MRRLSTANSLLLAQLLLALSSVSEAGLYTSQDGIVQLNSKNFFEKLSSRDCAWMVEFYATWCGHCRNLAPTIKKLAEQTESWRSRMSIAAVDCASPEGEDICREQGIESFPTIKYFGVRPADTDQGTTRGSYDMKIASLKYDMIDWLENNENLTDGEGAWPSLRPVKLSELPAARDDELVVVMVESPNLLLGTELIMDLTKQLTNSSLPIYRLEVKHSKLDRVLDRLGLQGRRRILPLLLIYRSGLVETVLEGPARAAEWAGAVKELLRATGEPGEEPAATTQQQPTTQAAATRREIIRRRYTVHMADLDRTVLYSLGSEVAKFDHIEGERLEALRGYVDVLIEYLPASPVTSGLLRDVSAWLAGRTGSAAGQELADLVEKRQNSTGGWMGCLGSGPQYGGYTCGLWTLWHVLTVSQWARDAGPPGRVLKAMLAYVGQFFGCRECARHFTAMVENGTLIDREAAASRRDSALLLWRLHNKVNRRLIGEAKPSEDPVFPKEVFPAREFCLPCYAADEESFNEDQVAEFLMGMYSEERISLAGTSVTRAEADQGATTGSASFPLLPDLVLIPAFLLGLLAL